MKLRKRPIGQKIEIIDHRRSLFGGYSSHLLHSQKEESA